MHSSDIYPEVNMESKLPTIIMFWFVSHNLVEPRGRPGLNDWLEGLFQHSFHCQHHGYIMCVTQSFFCDKTNRVETRERVQHRATTVYQSTYSSPHLLVNSCEFNWIQRQNRGWVPPVSSLKPVMGYPGNSLRNCFSWVQLSGYSLILFIMCKRCA